MVRDPSGMKLKGSSWQPADPCGLYYRLPGQKTWWMWSRPKYIQAHQALLSERTAELTDLEALAVDTAFHALSADALIPDPCAASQPLACTRTSQAPPCRPAVRCRTREMLTT